MKFKRINLRELIETDRNYPVHQSNARYLGSNLLGTVLETAGIKQEDSVGGKETYDTKR